MKSFSLVLGSLLMVGTVSVGHAQAGVRGGLLSDTQTKQLEQIKTADTAQVPNASDQEKTK